MEILLYGGAFSPVHIGHINILKQAINYKDFDKIIIVPTATFGHKNEISAPYLVRKEFINLSLVPLSDKIHISDYEYLKSDDSYSYKTIRHIKKEYEDAKLTFLIGQDNIINLKSWKNYEEIIKEVSFLAFLREDFLQDTKTAIENLKKDAVKIDLIKTEPVIASSSDIRQKIKKGESINSLVVKEVEDIIIENDIYSDNEKARMMNTAKYILNLALDEKRKIHTLNVAHLAKKLAKHYKQDEYKAEICALLHDVVKRVSPKEMLKRAKRDDIIRDIENKPFPTLHSFAGADFAKYEFSINDEDILWAIRSHTCARANMSCLEKIIYLADLLSEERRFKEKEDLLNLAFFNIDMAMQRALELSLVWLKQDNKVIDKDTKEALIYFNKLLT